MDKIPEFIKLLRPHQWLKSGFVLGGVFFAHSWSNSELVLQAITAAIIFSFLSSSVYIFNDIFDKQADKLHPIKSKRPLAADTISLPEAIILAILLLTLCLGAGFYISFKLGIIFIGYTILNFFYTLWLKNIVIIDVFIIAFGFMLRILAGTIGIGIVPSHWLLLCGFMFTLFLGFSKRYAEYRCLADNKSKLRKVLADYSPPLLNNLIVITASGAILTYAFYTLSPTTIQIHHTSNLIYTTLFVIFGIFRYIYLLKRKRDIAHIDIAYTTLHDKYLIMTIIAWLMVTLYLFVY